MLIRGAEYTPELMFPGDSLTLAVGEGTFTNYDDKHYLRSVLEPMINSKVEHLHSVGDFAGARWFAALRPRLLRGLPPSGGLPPSVGGDLTAARHSVAVGSSAVARLKARVKWRGEAEEAAWTAASGITLLLIASASDDLEATRELLSDARGVTSAANVNARAAADFKTLGLSWACLRGSRRCCAQ